MEGALADVGADAQHLADDGVGDVVAQVHQRQQHLLVREQLAGAPAADGALALGPLLLRLAASGPQFGQGDGQQFTERGGFQAQESADAVLGVALQLGQVHALIFGERQGQL